MTEHHFRPPSDPREAGRWLRQQIAALAIERAARREAGASRSTARPLPHEVFPE